MSPRMGSAGTELIPTATCYAFATQDASSRGSPSPYLPGAQEVFESTQMTYTDLVTDPKIVLGLVTVCVIARLLHNRYRHGLSSVPGPFLASLTDLWRLLLVWGRRPEQAHIKLHQRYGKFVRLGPNSVSVGDPQAIQAIYSPGSKFSKSDFYTVQQTVARGQPLFTLFTSTDDKFHAKLRRGVSSAYSMTTLVQFEPFVDSTTAEFLKQLDTRFARASDTVCDFSKWLQYYAFDVIGELTFSKRLGFIDGGRDVEGIISALEWLLDYAAVVGLPSWRQADKVADISMQIGQIPSLDRLYLKNPLRLTLSRLGWTSSNTPVAEFARKRIAEKLDSEKPLSQDGLVISGDETAVRRDFVSRFLEAHEKDPTFITKDRVLALTIANCFAGSDTTSISLQAIFYYLLKSPVDMERLMIELQIQKESGGFVGENGLVKWDQVKDLPFLNAVIKEGFRCHPAAGLPLERKVPDGGRTICDQYFPAGTIVGCSAWVTHRDEATFGKDADQYRPSRWIEASEEQRRLMDASLFQFGAGARTCIGKNISLLEIYKLVPAVLLRFEVRLAIWSPRQT